MRFFYKFQIPILCRLILTVIVPLRKLFINFNVTVGKWSFFFCLTDLASVETDLGLALNSHMIVRIYIITIETIIVQSIIDIYLIRWAFEDR